MIPNKRSPLIDTILHLDANAKLSQLITLVQSGSYSSTEMRQTVAQLLTRRWQLGPAFLLAKLLAQEGVEDPILSTARILGGMVGGNPEEERLGLESLRAQADRLSTEQQTTLYQTVSEIATSILGTPTLGPPIPPSDGEQMLRKGEIAKAILPHMRTRFDMNAPVLPLNLERMRQRGRAQARLISYPELSPPTRRQRRRVVVSMREHIFFGNPTARFADEGARILHAMQGYGWDGEESLFKTAPYRLAEFQEDCRNIIETCRRNAADLFIFDMNIIGDFLCVRTIGEMMAQLRQENSSIKIVGCILDAWAIPQQILSEMVALIDLAWTFDAPSLPYWSHPSVVGKVLQIVPVPLAVPMQLPDKPLIPQLLFHGNVVSNNFLSLRRLWLAASEKLGLPIQKRTSTHELDGLPPLEGYRQYRQGLYDATCVLNICMREQAVTRHIVSGRIFEGMLSGALVVQESTPDMCYYFVPGDHYLEFSTLAELASIVQFIENNRDEAEEIRHQGCAFARERYSDDKLLGHLDRLLYG